MGQRHERRRLAGPGVSEASDQITVLEVLLIQVLEGLSQCLCEYRELQGLLLQSVHVEQVFFLDVHHS